MERFRGLSCEATLVGLTAVYFAAGKIGLSFAQQHASASGVWPPTGIALAAFLLLGRRIWPALFFGAFLVNVTTAGNVATSLAIAAGNTLEGMAGAWLVDRFAAGLDAFERPRNVFLFVLLAAPATWISATVGAASLCLGGVAAWPDYGAIWLTWWLGDMGGAIVVAPALMLWFTRGAPRWSRSQLLELAGLLFGTVVVGGIVFGGVPPSGAYPLSFLCVPLTIWPAFRFGPRETATTVLVLSAIAVGGTVQGYGPFWGVSEEQTSLLLQMFMAVIMVTGLSVAALVSEHRRALAALGRQATELASSNAELEAFAHVVSHDLKAPLRGLSSLATFVAEDCKGILPEQSREHLHTIDQRAKQMGRLIEGVLEHSRIGRRPAASGPVNVEALLEEVIDLLDPSPGVSVRVEGPIPAVEYDRTQLAQVFQNLIGNAVQHLGRPSGSVRVSGTERAGDFEFSVRDDGVGIDERHFDRIFRIFQTLRPETTSTGVGLAIVKKIVETNGGRVSVESTPGVGATFRFTVPKAAGARRR